MGNTSTYVEKMFFLVRLNIKRRKHLHIRGENSSEVQILNLWIETPPHTWRKSLAIKNAGLKCGNTSTYVEKIPSRLDHAHQSEKHLHIRGENSVTATTRSTGGETPPHTWRKSDFWEGVHCRLRNTSTYVEKIIDEPLCCFSDKKHLHIRGENWLSALMKSQIIETPPHTWRKWAFRILVDSLDQKHLHIRGENVVKREKSEALRETPPHTWRKCYSPIGTTLTYGNTSTYVEKIRERASRCEGSQKHLHIRGENNTRSCSLQPRWETPPHTWRK